MPDNMVHKGKALPMEPIPLEQCAPKKIKLLYDAKGRPVNFRPPGSVAGSWPHTPWSTCVLYDPYERVNVWSHGVPGALFLLLGLCTMAAGHSEWQGLVLFSFCAAATQLFSALTHVWPDDHYLEKLDHLGIVALVVGTPMSAIMVQHPEASYTVMYSVMAAMFVCAFMPPTLRVVGFMSGTIFIVGLHWDELWCTHIAIELGSYLLGAIAFLRNKGHGRGPGLADHHFLHYFCTFSTLVHLHYLCTVSHAFW